MVIQVLMLFSQLLTNPFWWKVSLGSGELLLSPTDRWCERKTGELLPSPTERSCSPPSQSFSTSSSAAISAEVHSPMLSVSDAHDPMLEEDRMRRKSCRWVRWYLQVSIVFRLISGGVILDRSVTYWEGRTTISSWPRETVPISRDVDWFAVNKAKSEGAKSNGVNPRLEQIELQICEWKNNAIPLVPKFPSPYSIPDNEKNKNKKLIILMQCFQVTRDCVNLRIRV